MKVPRLRGESSGNARMVLRSLGLRVRSVAVPAPGLEPGTVTRQVPAAGAELPPGARVKLYLAEVPRWRPVASLHGNTLGQTVPFRVRGRRWRIVYTMDYLGTCTFIFICSGPTAHVTQLGGEARGSQFDLAQGQNEIQSLSSGAGTYQVTVSPGNDTASWAMKIEDYY